MITFKQYLAEHCKRGEYFKPFNLLQIKILRSLYDNFLVPNEPEFSDLNVDTDEQLVNMYFDRRYDALSLLGDVLCKYIPDEKTVNHTKNDVDRWASQLYKLIRTTDNENV